jgi:type I restriction enzyme M protein
MASNHSEFQRRLWEAADQLRASEYSVPVLGLIFLKYADSRLEEATEWFAGPYSPRRGGPK